METIQGLSQLAATQPNKSESAVTKSSNAFGKILTELVDNTNQAQINGDKAVENFEAGNAQHLHEVMISAEEAEISLKMLVQMRNKALTAYEEIMRLQI